MRLKIPLAVKAVIPLCQLLLVVGSQNSSNSRRLVEVCEKTGVPAYLIDDLGEVKPEWLSGIQTVAVTAGASAPENLVQELIGSLQDSGFTMLEENGDQGRGRAIQSSFGVGPYRKQLQTVFTRMSSPGLQVGNPAVMGHARALRRGVQHLLDLQREQVTGGRISPRTQLSIRFHSA